MNATPVDRPSSPSIQLMLLIIPTIQKIVSPAAIGPTEAKRIGAAAERVGDEVDRDPQGDCEAGQRDLTEQLDARPQVEQVVDGAEPSRDRPTEQQRRHLRWREGERDRHEVRTLVDEQEEAGDEQERGADRQATAARDGDRVDAPGLRSVDHPVAQDDGADHGREDQGEQPREHEADHDRAEGVADARDEGHRVTARDGRMLLPPSRGGQARHREAGDDLADLAREPAWAAGSSRFAIASMMIRPTSASRRVRTRAMSSPGCRSGSPTRCSAGACRTGSRSC